MSYRVTFTTIWASNAKNRKNNARKKHRDFILLLSRSTGAHAYLLTDQIRTLISTHWIGNDRFDCEVTRPPSCRVGCTQKDRYTQHKRIIIIQCFDGNRSKEPIKSAFSLFISDNSLPLKFSMRKIINSINKLPGEHAREYFSKWINRLLELSWLAVLKDND